MRFKGLLNISVVAAGLRRLLCRFCAFPLLAGAGRLSSPGAGAVASAAGGALLPGREGVYQGVAEKQGVSLARGIGLYTHLPSPLSENRRGGVWGSVGVPSGGVAEKGGGGFYVEHYENN